MESAAFDVRAATISIRPCSGRIRERWLRALGSPHRRAYNGEHMTDLSEFGREWTELLNEVRVVLPGVQLLFAFLLTAPFTARFAEITSAVHAVFLASFFATTGACAFLIAPSVYHRLHWRRDVVDKEEMLRTCSRLAVVAWRCWRWQWALPCSCSRRWSSRDRWSSSRPALPSWDSDGYGSCCRCRVAGASALADASAQLLPTKMTPADATGRESGCSGSARRFRHSRGDVVVLTSFKAVGAFIDSSRLSRPRRPSRGRRGQHRAGLLLPSPYLEAGCPRKRAGS